jgi:hypothetical protein
MKKQGDKAERLVPESEESVAGECTTAGLDTSANQTVPSCTAHGLK